MLDKSQEPWSQVNRNLPFKWELFLLVHVPLSHQLWKSPKPGLTDDGEWIKHGKDANSILIPDSGLPAYRNRRGHIFNYKWGWTFKLLNQGCVCDFHWLENCKSRAGLRSDGEVDYFNSGDWKGELNAKIKVAVAWPCFVEWCGFGNGCTHSIYHTFLRSVNEVPATWTHVWSILPVCPQLSPLIEEIKHYFIKCGYL